MRATITIKVVIGARMANTVGLAELPLFDMGFAELPACGGRVVMSNSSPARELTLECEAASKAAVRVRQKGEILFPIHAREVPNYKKRIT